MRQIFTFDTTHHALWAEEVAVENTIPAEVIPAPPAANAKCNLAIETLPEDADHFGQVLAAAGVPFVLYYLGSESEGPGEPGLSSTTG